MFKKAVDVLEECKSSSSKEDTEDAFGKHIAHKLRSFFIEAAIFPSF